MEKGRPIKNMTDKELLEWAKKFRQRHRERAKKYAQTPKEKEKRKKYRKEYYQRPEVKKRRNERRKLLYAQTESKPYER